MIQNVGTEQADERALCARLADRDIAAFALLYDRHAPAVFGYAARLLGATAAETVVEDTFLALWRGAPDAVARGVALRAWLLSTAHSLVRARLGAGTPARHVTQASAPGAASPIVRSPSKHGERQDRAMTDNTEARTLQDPAADVAPSADVRDDAERKAAMERMAARDQFEAREALLDRKRDALWSEVHDAFDSRTALVDARADGSPLGNPREDRPTGPRSVPPRRAPR